MARGVNNFSSVLAEDYTPGSGTMTLRAGDLARVLLAFTPSSGTPLRLTVARAAAVYNNFIVNPAQAMILTGDTITGDVLSGITVIEGTTDQPFYAGDPIACTVTEGAIEDGGGGGGGGGDATSLQGFDIATATPLNTQVLAWNGGTTEWTPTTLAIVSTVFGRSGPAVSAQSGDYSVGQVTGAAPLASPTFTGQVTAPVFATTAANAGYILTRRDTLAVSWLIVDPGGSFELINQAGMNISLAIDTATNVVTLGGSLAIQTMDSSALIAFRAPSDTTSNQAMALLTTEWATATHASRKGRIKLSAFDTVAAREGVRVETNGSVALVGFFGATAVARQSGDVATGLVNLGLFSSATVSVGAGGSPGNVQYNNSGVPGGFGNWDGTTLALPNRLSVPTTDGNKGLVATNAGDDLAILQGWNGAGATFWFFSVGRYWTGSSWDYLPGGTAAARRGAMFDVNSGTTPFRWQTAPAANAGLTTIANMDTAGRLRLGDSTGASYQLDVVGAGKIDGTAILGAGEVVVGAADGFPYITTCLGVPVGTPTAVTGYAPLVVDSTNEVLYYHGGAGWHAALRAVGGTAANLAINTHTSPHASPADVAGTTTCDASGNDSFVTSLTAHTTLLITNAVVDQEIHVKVIQGSGPYTLAYSGTNTITWFTAGFVAPTLPTTNGNALKIVLICTGTNAFDGFWWGNSGT